MKKTPTANPKGKKSRPKSKLGIPDLELSKAAVLRSLGSPDSRRGYQHAIDEFVAWYCSEPRQALPDWWCFYGTDQWSTVALHAADG